MALDYIVQGRSAGLTSVASQIFLVRIPFPCTLKEIEISLGSIVPEGQQAVFDVNAGASAAELASLFPTLPAKPKATAGQTAAVKTGLNIALAKGFLTVDADAVPLGGINAPVFLSLTIDDGLPAGVTVEGAEDVPVSVVASKLIVNPADLTALGGGAVRLLTPSDLLGVANGAARLDGDSKLYVSQLPAIALVNRFVVADEAARLALAAADVQPGDFAFQVDESEVYLLIDADPSDPDSWALWLHPAIPTTLPPSGAAGGDLSGDFPSPSVSGIRGRSLGGIQAPGATFTDDFSDNTFNAELWTRTSSADVAEQNGRIEIRNANFLTFNSAGVNMTDKFIQCEIQAAGSMIFRIVHTSDPEGENIQITNSGSDLNFQKRTGSSTTTINSIPYDATAHKFVRIEHVSASGLWVCSTSPTGAAGTWTVRSSFTPSLSVASVLPRWYCTAGGFQYFDNITSNIIATDPLTNKNLFAVMWEQATNQFGIFRTLGVIPLTTGAPAGAPSNVPAGHTVLMYDAASHTLYAWNGSTWDSQAF
jgi:hypothetical protein